MTEMLSLQQRVRFRRRHILDFEHGGMILPAAARSNRWCDWLAFWLLNLKRVF
jgi:hypothetical protein